MLPYVSRPMLKLLQEISRGVNTSLPQYLIAEQLCGRGLIDRRYYKLTARGERYLQQENSQC